MESGNRFDTAGFPIELFGFGACINMNKAAVSSDAVYTKAFGIFRNFSRLNTGDIDISRMTGKMFRFTFAAFT